MAHIDYDTDILKHYVRIHGWLAACQRQVRAIRRRNQRIPLRYFTFCAAQAIDVFMLERAQILRRSEQTGRLEGVFFCEKDEEDFGKIANLIGSPEQGFLGDFTRIVLFEDDEDTEGRELYAHEDEAYSQEVRRKLRYKDAHKRLQRAFPFDIINLDVFGVMFPPKKGVIAPLLKSLIRIMEWQTVSQFPNETICKQFALFVTSHIDIDKTNQEAIQQLANLLSDNIEMNEDFRSAFAKRYGYQEATRLALDNFAEFFCLALPKFIIQQALLHLGWEVVHEPTYLYNRDDRYVTNRQYQVMHSVSVYKRISDFGQRLDGPGLRQYKKIVTELINNEVIWVDKVITKLDIRRVIEEDLADIVKFRDKAR